MIDGSLGTLGEVPFTQMPWQREICSAHSSISLQV